MALRFRKSTTYKNTAYTLAEVLVVMSIIMLIILALPPVTKKVFKIGDARSPHGRYECYWEDGKLYQYMKTDGGTTIGPSEVKGKNYCEFIPPKNSIYFIMHAVGGGGAGALVAEIDTKNSAGAVIQKDVTDLEPKQQNVQAMSYLVSNNPIAWPAWVTWMNKGLKPDELPWYDKNWETVVPKNTSKMKARFDVGSIETKQQVRYRVGGSAGRVVSTFMPEMPRGVKLRLTPGKGGKLNASGYGTGGDGGDTTIEYVYEGKSPIESIRARGGAGGNGSIDSRATYSLIGGSSTDFGLSNMASIKSKTSGFSEIIENIAGNEVGFDLMKSHVPDSAGNSGGGETQFVEDTDGTLYYEHGKFDSIVDNVRRVNWSWEGITTKIGKKFLDELYSSTKSNCTVTTSTTPIEVTREGYCATDLTKGTNPLHFVCAIGEIPAGAMANLVYSSNPYYETSVWNSSTWTYDKVYYYNQPWRKFEVSVSVSNVAGRWIYGTPVFVEKGKMPPSPDIKTIGTEYYECKFDTNIQNVSCKTTIPAGATIYKCTKEKSGKCANGDTPKGRNPKGTAYTASGDEKMKCPAHEAGDGAVVILW